jgi:hypothetical protein
MKRDIVKKDSANVISSGVDIWIHMKIQRYASILKIDPVINTAKFYIFFTFGGLTDRIATPIRNRLLKAVVPIIAKVPRLPYPTFIGIKISKKFKIICGDPTINVYNKTLTTVEFHYYKGSSFICPFSSLCLIILF